LVAERVPIPDRSIDFTFLAVAELYGAFTFNYGVPREEPLSGPHVWWWTELFDLHIAYGTSCCFLELYFRDFDTRDSYGIHSDFDSYPTTFPCGLRSAHCHAGN
jgi:hypothetical protein